jgi:Glycosyltransferase family 87
MSVTISAARVAARRATAVPLRRSGFAVLLVSVPLLPRIGADPFDYPAVSNGWVCLPLCGLILLAVSDVRPGPRWAQLDLLAFLSLTVSLICWRAWRTWPTVLLYALLAYLAVRMLALAEIGGHRPRERAPALRAALPRSWLLIGIAVLVVVHVTWALQSTARIDVASAGIQGARALTHGQPLYVAPSAHARIDPHLDTYGPVNYEAYVPFFSTIRGYSAARATALFFDLLTALLLFLLGRNLRGSETGTLLAFCWLAYPFTLYGDVLALNDSILAAMLTATLLAARRPLRRGFAAALAAWTKLSPLALVPLLAGCDARGRGGARRLLMFGGAFALATLLVFGPVLMHDSPASFISRTFGFQAARPPSLSLWAIVQDRYAGAAPWLGPTSRVAHGVLLALTGTLALLLVAVRRRRDMIGLAAASAAVMIALELCLSYFPFSYVLWFAPFALVALLLGEGEEQRGLRRPPQPRPGAVRRAGAETAPY